MDTNVKKFKYSTINKIICIVLCLLTFCIGSWYAVLSATAVIYKIEGTYKKAESTDDWTNSQGFYRLLSAYSANAIGLVNETKDIAYLEQQYEDNKEKYIDEAYNKVLSLKKRAEEKAVYNYEYENSEEFYDDEDETTLEYTTVPAYEEFFDAYSLNIDGIYICDIDIDASMSKDDVKNAFEKSRSIISRNITDHYYSYNHYGVVVNFSPNGECNYYAVHDDTESSNVENFNEKLAYGSDYYFISKHGNLEYKGISEEVAEDVFSNLSGRSRYFKDTDLYLYFSVEDLSASDLIDLAFQVNDRQFSQLYTFNIACRNANANLKRNICIAVISFVLSFVFGFIYFSITGKKDDEDNAKLFFYDLIPFELSLAVAVGLGAGAFYLMGTCFMEAYTVSTALLYIIWALAVFYWVLLFFVSASFARNLHSGKKFYKHFLTYWLLLAIWKILEFIYKCIKALLKFILKVCRKTKNSAIRSFNAFIFKTHQFKRNILFITVAWLFINLLSIMFAILAGINEAGFICFLFFVGTAVLDFFALRKFGEYVKNLDTIIDAASRHEEVLLDLDNLDNSLKTLAESMRYTNAELHNAIAKAVKDERLRTELITNVSHDLKTPLTSIITYVDLLSKCDIKDEKAQEYIKVLDDKGAKLKRLIDDLIEASKVTSGNVTVNLAPMNLSELCLQATVDAQTDFEKAGLELIVKQGEKPSIVIADGTKANRVIENLLSNARKYSAKASRVYVSVYNENNYGVFEIKNVSAQPLDISPEELTERFVRGDKARNQDGNGLGLSIAKELCQLQNGKLELIIDGDLFKAKVMFPNKQP